MGRRFRYINGKVVEITTQAMPAKTGDAAPIVSDSLGFPEQCLTDRQRQLNLSGVSGVEFKRDPACPEFYQVHASSRHAMERYTRTRGMVNRTGSLGGAATLTQTDLDKAKAIVERAG